MSAVLLGCAVSGAWASIDVSGVPLEETVTVAGVPLKLNGAGFRKRGYFKIDVTAVYLQQKATSLDAVESAPGPKRVQLVIQQDVTGSQASRYFLIDFEASATPAEFAKLITEVSQVGDIYSSLPKIKKGDVVTMELGAGQGPHRHAQRRRADAARLGHALHEQRTPRPRDAAHVHRRQDAG